MSVPSSATTINPATDTVSTMKPYLHLSGGDMLLFSSLEPSSPGAIFGACVGLFILACLDRLLAGLRRTLETRWTARMRGVANITSVRTGETKEMESMDEKEIVHVRSEMSIMNPRPKSWPASRLSFDILRGVMYTLQALAGYALMLCAMTFNIAYVIAIVLGLGVGEALFFRFIPSVGDIVL